MSAAIGATVVDLLAVAARAEAGVEVDPAKLLRRRAHAARSTARSVPLLHVGFAAAVEEPVREMRTGRR